METNKKPVYLMISGVLIGALVTAGIFLVYFKSHPQIVTQEIVKEKIIKECPSEVKGPSGPYPAPTYSLEIPDPLETDVNGEVRVTWTAVPGAVKYHIVLWDQNGKKVKLWKTHKTTLYLKDVPYHDDQDETYYKITVQSIIDDHDSVGSESVPRGLVAKKLKNIVAPTIKAISIED